jgi:hypothetical protein
MLNIVVPILVLVGSLGLQTELNDATKSLTADKPTHSVLLCNAPGEGDEMPTKQKQQEIPGWFPETRKGDFEVGLDKSEKHSGTQSAYLKSAVSKPKEFGNLTQAFVPNNYLGKRLKMSAWVKTKLTGGTAQLWLRIDGDWKSAAAKPGCFDNMDDRPIKGDNDWTQYSLVCDVPDTSNHVVFGCFLHGTGQVWLDDVSFEVVGKDVPLTGKYATLTGCGKQEPINLSFEDKAE